MRNILEFTLPDIVVPLSNALSRVLCVELGIPSFITLDQTIDDGNHYRGKAHFILPNEFIVKIYFDATITQLKNPIDDWDDITLTRVNAHVPKKWRDEGWITKQFDDILFPNSDKSVMHTNLDKNSNSISIIVEEEQIPLLIRGSRSFNRKTRAKLLLEANPPEQRPFTCHHLGG